MLEIKRFPQDMSVFEVDRSETKRCFFEGLYEETVKTGEGARRFYTYLKPGLVYNRPCVVLALPSGVTAPEYLERAGWIRFAEKHEVFLHAFPAGDNGWRADGSDADDMNRVYVEIQSRKYYVTMQDNIYAIGVGDGADVAQQAVMKMSSDWSGLATFGDLTEAALRNAEETHGGAATGGQELAVGGGKAQTPVWMAWSADEGPNADVRAYWMKQNDSNGERFSNEWADEIYFPSTVVKKSQINEEKIAQVRVTNGFAGEPGDDLKDAVWAYLSEACRHRGFGVKMLRRRIDPERYGFAYHEVEHRGFTRRWYEYVPERVAKSLAPAPLVVCMHGRGGTAESFLSLSGMSRVAEERDFIMIFPEAGLYQQRPGGLRNVLLWNGGYRGEDMDDVGFVLRAVEDAKKRLPVDSTRVYVCGQSSGGMMTHELARRAPQVFAAASPWSALVDPAAALDLPEAIDPAVPYLFLFGDRDWVCADREHGEMEYHVTHEIAETLRRLISLYRLNETPGRYTCGEIDYYVYSNADGVPMLKVGVVSGMPHANYPRESWIAYDEFFSKFSKDADGTLRYMGVPVR